MALSYEENDVTTTNISERLPHTKAGKQLTYIYYEEITSLSPYRGLCIITAAVIWLNVGQVVTK